MLSTKGKDGIDEFLGEYIEQPAKQTQNIFVGSQVIMTKQYDVPNEYKGVIWTVDGPPRFNNGKRYVRLKGYNTDYPVDGLKVVG